MYTAKVAYSHQTICWSVCVCLSSALWQNMDTDVVCDVRSDGLGMRQLVSFGDWSLPLLFMSACLFFSYSACLPIAISVCLSVCLSASLIATLLHSLLKMLWPLNKELSLKFSWCC